MGNGHKGGFRLREYVLFAAVTLVVFALCVSLGSVNVPLNETLSAIRGALTGTGGGSHYSIIITVRLPRVICVALVGAALSVCGAAMQGLLRNPLADGTTLGVSSAASLGAVIVIALGAKVPGLPAAASTVMAIAFSFGALIIILSLARRLDYSLSTNTIILIGVIFSMFCNSLSSLVITFADEKVRNIVFWTMGSLAGSNYGDALLLGATLLVCSCILLRYSNELNAFAIGEENALHVGIDVRRVKLVVLATVSILVGVCVSVSGTIGFVGLVIPHMSRRLTGPNHRRLLPATLFGGAVFLMLADLVSRTLLSPRELPIGVVTSMVGAMAFVYIFYRTRKAG